MRRYRKYLAVAISVQLLANLITGCAAADKAKDIGNGAVKKVGSIQESITEWYSKINLDKFKNGWNYAVKLTNSKYGAVAGSEYVKEVGTAINKLKTDINAGFGSMRGISQEAGYAAEKWTADTFNIDAVARGSKNRAQVKGSNELASVDVETITGENVSLKYYKTGSESAAAQSKTIIEKYREYCGQAKSRGTERPLTLPEYLEKNGYDKETQKIHFSSIYAGQTRIIPADQMDAAVAYLQGRITKLSTIEGEVANARSASYRETLLNLKDRLEAPDGTKSVPASYDEMQAIAELSEAGKFDPEDFGINVSTMIKPQYILKQAIGVGAETAVLSAVLAVGPDIYAILSKAAETGEVSEEDLKTTGVDGVIAASEGFVEGAVSNAILTACKAGKLGASLKNIKPTTLGTLTILTVNAVRYGYSLANGNITVTDYSNLMAEDIVTAIVSQETGALLQILLPVLPFAYLIGSMAGGMMASAGIGLTKDIAMRLKDGGGFAVFVPDSTVNSPNVARDTIAKLNIADQLTNFKNFVVSTVSDGYIKIRAVKI